jgi:hypothetical protein
VRLQLLHEVGLVAVVRRVAAQRMAQRAAVASAGDRIKSPCVQATRHGALMSERFCPTAPATQQPALAPAQLQREVLRRRQPNTRWRRAGTRQWSGGFRSRALDGGSWGRWVVCQLGDVSWRGPLPRTSMKSRCQLVTCPALEAKTSISPFCGSAPPGSSGTTPTAGRGRCASIFLGQTGRHLGKSQSTQPPQRTPGPPHRRS